MLNPQLYIYSDSIFNKQEPGVAFIRGNEDYIDFGTGKAWIDPSNFTIEIKISNFVNLQNGFGSGIIGQPVWSGAFPSARWSLFVDNQFSRNNIGFNLGINGVNETNFNMPFVSSGIIKVTGLAGNYEMFLNDVLMDSQSGSVETIPTNVRMLIAAYNEPAGLGGGVKSETYATGKVNWAKITSFGVTNILELNEGSGNIVTWSEGDTGEIKTSNPSGINYINDTMWKLKIVEESGLQDVEIFEEDNVVLTSSVVNLKDISKIFTDFTKSFTVPASPANNKIFQHWYKAEIEGGFNANLRKTATMELNLQPFKTGKIQLNKVQKKNGVAVNYQLQFFGDVVQLTDSFGEDLLTDLDLSAYAHTFNSDNVKDGLRGGYLLGAEVIYPLISPERVWTWDDSPATNTDIQNSTSLQGIHWNELKPAIKLQKIIDAISLKYGLTFSDHFFNSSDFLRLWMWASREKGLMKAYGSNDILQFVQTSGSPTQTFTTYNTEEDDEKITLTITPEATYEEVPYTLTKKVLSTDTGTTVTTTTQRSGTSQDIVTKTSTEGLKAVTYYIAGGEAFSYVGSLAIFRFGDGDYEGDTGVESVTGTVNFTDITVDGIKQFGQLPEMKVVDFFRGLTKMFNLVVVPDGDRFIVQTLDDWYAAGTTKDFSKYIDLSTEDVNRTDIYKVINFTYQEPETIIQDAFEDTNDRFYGDLEYESDVDGETFEIELPFETLVGSLISDSDGTLTNIRTYSVIDKDLEPVKTKPLIFYYTNTNTAPTADLAFWDDTGSKVAVTGYNDVGQENAPLEELVTHTLNWGSELSTLFLSEMTNSLFADYWSTYITDIFDENRRMFKFSGIIPSGVLSTLKLNDKLIINGRRYIINQYTANLKTGKVDFELLNDVLELPAEATDYSLQHELQTELHG